MAYQLDMAPNPVTETSDWWDNQIDLHPPKNPTVGSVMDEVRGAFTRLGHELIRSTPPGPDLTVALRSLKEASMHAIGNIACNQEFYDD